MVLRGETAVLGEKPVRVPLCAPQILRGLSWDRKWTSAERGRRLITWAMARPTGDWSPEPWHGQPATDRLRHGTTNRRLIAWTMAPPTGDWWPEPWHRQPATDRLSHCTANRRLSAWAVARSSGDWSPEPWPCHVAICRWSAYP